MPIIKAMKHMSALLRVLSLFAFLGMLIAPVSTIAAEYAMADMSKATAVSMDEMAGMAGMAGEMPCCPDEQPVKPDCDKSCPFVIICSTSAQLALLKTDWASVSLSWTDQVYGETRFARLNSLAGEPPARPPKA
jgi:hypothetical protein